MIAKRALKKEVVKAQSEGGVVLVTPQHSERTGFPYADQGWWWQWEARKELNLEAVKLYYVTGT